MMAGGIALNDVMAALVMAIASGMGVGGAAWLLLFQPFRDQAVLPGPDPQSASRGDGQIDWGRAARCPAPTAYHR
jgi:hypothetical protein